MGLNLFYVDGQTPLDDEEKEGLIVKTIATRGELDEFEQQNIERAVQWSIGRSIKPELIFTENFVRLVHKRMYGQVWKWAGEFRNSNKNIGTDKWQISTALKSLLDDAKYWHVNNVYGPDELAIRFKHKLVSIHCFPNGNGRHSRLMADIIIQKVFMKPEFSWGASAFATDNTIRDSYLKAIRLADKRDFSLLLEFARS